MHLRTLLPCPCHTRRCCSPACAAPLSCPGALGVPEAQGCLSRCWGSGRGAGEQLGQRTWNPQAVSCSCCFGGSGQCPVRLPTAGALEHLRITESLSLGKTSRAIKSNLAQLSFFWKQPRCSVPSPGVTQEVTKGQFSRRSSEFSPDPN